MHFGVRVGAALAWWVALAGGLAAAEDDAWLGRVRERVAGGVVRWGGDAEGNAPYQFRDQHDPARVIGFEVEIADALAVAVTERVGRPVRFAFTQYEWVSLPLGLKKPDFDCIISGLETTPENRQQFRFTRPYFRYAQQLTVRAGEERIASLDDCASGKVGTIAGTAADRLLQRREIKPLTYTGQVEAYADLDRGRIDAVLLDWPIAAYYAADKTKFKHVGPRLEPSYYAIALRPNDADLARLLDLALGDVISQGKLEAILKKWGIWTDDQLELAAAPPEATDPGSMLADAAEQWTFDRYGPVLLKAAGMTVFLSLASMALAMALGLVVALGRTYGPAPVRFASLAFIEFFRGVPLLLVLTFIYYGLPSIVPALADLPAVAAAILGFGLNYAAYEAEIYRSAILSVPRGQWEAGRALGMNERTTFRRVIFPQAIRTALGPMTNDFVAMFKDTSLVSVIAVEELTKEYLVLARSSMKFVEIGLLTAALYLAMSLPLGYLSRYLERRWGTGR